VANWFRLWRLSSAERWLLAQALALLPLTALALWAVGFRRWQALLDRLSPAGAAAEGDEAALVRQGRAAARLVDAAARRGAYRATCLPRSLVLWWLLRRRGIAADLRIGVRKEAAEFQAHAWVEYRGTVLNDGTDVSERFARFDRAIVPAIVRG
jgi:hypothetical protein